MSDISIRPYPGKHTQGDWEVVHEGECLMVYPTHHEHSICAVGGDIDDEGHFDALSSADAKFIAPAIAKAAWELLEVLPLVKGPKDPTYEPMIALCEALKKGGIE